MNTEVSRRQFTRECSLTGMALAFSTSTMAQPSSTSTQPIPIIDTHIHLFDPDRPQGAPYTGPPGVPTEAAFPKRYRSLAESLGVVGAIKVEASPWVEDNLWALQVAQTDDIMVGVVGNLQPEKPEFAEYLERYRKNRLFRGIRYGNLWDRDLKKQMSNPKFVEGLKLLAESDLVLDSANPNISLLQGLVAANDKIPNLRIVIDHLPNLETTDKTAKIYEQLLREIKQRPNMFVKLSSVIHPVNGKTSTELKAYRSRLDRLMDVFGEDRIIFGSDWPNSDGVAPIDRIFGIVKEYFATKPRQTVEKYFWRNSMRIYKWIARTNVQKALSER